MHAAATAQVWPSNLHGEVAHASCLRAGCFELAGMLAVFELGLYSCACAGNPEYPWKTSTLLPKLADRAPAGMSANEASNAIIVHAAQVHDDARRARGNKYLIEDRYDR